MAYKHIPVMTNEVIQYMNCQPGKIYVDCTLGGAGHTAAICKIIAPSGHVIGIDQDNDAVCNAKKVLEPFKSMVHLFNENFINLPFILSSLNIEKVDGIILDLGLSLHQLESSGRGFSFKREEPLDMRMDTRTRVKAEDIINTMDATHLSELFYNFGEERRARIIAKTIVETREHVAIKTSKQLADIIYHATFKKSLLKQKIHPATKVFMALRIAVNKELERLDSFMEKAACLLNPKGRLCAISFHSLEDRIIKHRIKAMEKGCICLPDLPICTCNKKKSLRSLTKKALRPKEKEVDINPMARSAKLRAAEKI